MNELEDVGQMTADSSGIIKQKLREHFDGKIVRKDLTKKMKEGANVPVYVLEFLLGQYCSSDDEEVVEEGVNNVKRILADNFVRPDESQKILSQLRKKGSHTIIDTFADFKRRFFEGELFSESGKKQFWPRMKLSIRYKKPFEQVFGTLSDFIGKMSEVLAQLQDSGFFGFDEFHKGMKEKLEGTETELNGEFLRIILDTFLVEPGERFVNAKKNPFKFIQKRAGGVESKYRIINNNHLGLASRFIRLLSERKPISGDDYIAYIPTADGSEKDNLMRLLNMLEILGLSSYEIRGGANVEVFVRINDPMKLKYLSTGKYTNLILRDIESKNNSAMATLSSFFRADLTSEQRWDVVENYFLGNESAVKEALGVG